MTKKLYPEENIQAIATAIRGKNGSSETYTVGEMAAAIDDIPTGGGGGSSNIVVGTFKVQDENGVQEIDIPYTGNGYPVVAHFGLKGGLGNDTETGDSAWQQTTMERLICAFSAEKKIASNAPTYSSSDADKALICSFYAAKSKVAPTYNYSISSSGVDVFHSTYCGNMNGYDTIKFRANNKLAVYAKASGSQYGLLSGAEYEYIIEYSE